MIKTYRDVKMGLELSRERKIPCRTVQIESSVRKEIESKYGDLQRFSTGIVAQEKMRRHRQNLSVEKSRLKLLVTKEKLGALQQARAVPLDPKPSSQKPDAPLQKNTNNLNTGAPLFRKVKLKY